MFVRAAFIVGHFDFDYFFQVDSQVSAKVRDPDHRVSQFDGHAFGLSAKEGVVPRIRVSRRFHVLSLQVF